MAVTFHDSEADDQPVVTIANLRVVDDAGGAHLESVVAAGDLVAMMPPDGSTPDEDTLLRPVNNIRPEHVLTTRKRDGSVVYREGTMQIKPGKQRRKVERWTRQLINEVLDPSQRDPEARRPAVLGNLSVRLHPRFFEDGTAVLLDDEGYEMKLEELGDHDVAELLLYPGAFFDSGVDSLSRLKAVAKAEQSMPGCVADRRCAVRFWIADDDTAEGVAHAYNQEGDPVNATAAKYRHQDSLAQGIARMLMDRSQHLGAKNVEVMSNRVSASSNKLCSFNTLSLAIEKLWPHVPFDGDEAETERQAEYLVKMWDALVAVRPEYGFVDLSQRRAWRASSIAGSAVSIHGIVDLAAQLYPGDDFSVLEGLTRPVTLREEAAVKRVDLFSYDNPAWTDAGVLVRTKKKDKTGNEVERLELRMSFQTRKAAGEVIRQHLGV